MAERPRISVTKSYEDNVDPDSPEVKMVRVNATKVKEEHSSILERLARFSGFHRAKYV